MLRWREPLDPPEDPKDTKKQRVIPQVRTTEITGGMPLAMAWGMLQPPKQTAQPKLVVGCTDKTVKVYNAGMGLTSNLTGHGDWVYCVAISADGMLFCLGQRRRHGQAMERDRKSAAGHAGPGGPERDGWLILTAPGYFAASTPAAIGWDKMSLTMTPEQLAETLAKPIWSATGWRERKWRIRP